MNAYKPLISEEASMATKNKDGSLAECMTWIVAVVLLAAVGGWSAAPEGQFGIYENQTLTCE